MTLSANLAEIRTIFQRGLDAWTDGLRDMEEKIPM